MFVATDGAVSRSTDWGRQWAGISDGLPSDLICASLAVAATAGAPRRLYPATWGRSVWMLDLEQPAGLPKTDPCSSIEEEIATVADAMSSGEIPRAEGLKALAQLQAKLRQCRAANR